MYQNCNLGVGYGAFNPYPSYYPTVPTVNQPQQQGPAYTYPVLTGRVVNRLEDITPNEVPMDGTSSLFPLKDESAVYIKSWNSDGTIKTTKYIREEETVHEEPKDPFSDLKNYIQSRFDDIEEVCKKGVIVRG